MNLKKSFRVALASGLLVLGCLAAVQAPAAVVISGTRVIYTAPDRETTVKISNKGKRPALMQAWVDQGDDDAAPGAIEVPFTVTPPIGRIEPGKAQTLRIFYTGEPLPKDRESVFWLNVLEIPPEPGAEMGDRNFLQFAIRSRIKLFYRPVGLKGTASEAPAQLVWSLAREDGQPVLEVRNPSAYHVSFNEIALEAGGQRVPAEGGMVAPGENKRFALHGQVAPGQAKVRYRAINDWGGSTESEAALSNADSVTH